MIILSTATISRVCQKPNTFSVQILKSEKIEELASKIKPICRRTWNGKSELWYFFVDDLWNTALTVSPMAVVIADKLSPLPINTITTYHRPIVTDDEEMFKPSAAEVLSQIPSELLRKVVAYEVTQRNTNGKNIVGVSDRDRAALKAGYLLAEVKLYAKK